MKKLKVFNAIAFSVCTFVFPYILIDYNNFFFGKNKDDSLLTLCIIMFIVSFICGFIIFMSADSKRTESRVSLYEILKLGKRTLIPPLFLLLAGNVFLLIFIKSEINIVYFIVSFVSMFLALAEKAIINKIDVSPYYKLSQPWYMLVLPFGVMIAGVALSVTFVPEDKLIQRLYFSL